MTRWLVVFIIMVWGWLQPAAAAPQLERAAHHGRVVVYAEPGLDDTAQELATVSERALTEIADDLPGLATPKIVEIRIVRDAADLAAIAPPGRGAPQWAIGVAYPDLSIVAIALRREANHVDPVHTLRHELAHIALAVALGDRAPRWLHEGFAYQHSAEGSNERIETLAGMAWFGTAIPLEELESSFPAAELIAHRAYAESYDFVGFLARRGRWQDADDDGDRYPFRRFLADIGHGATPDAAATRAFGRPLARLFEEWREDLLARYRFIPLSVLGLALWVVCSLLVVVAWWRRRRQNRVRLAQWEREERERHASTQVIAPPYVPWPGEDPFDDERDPDDRDRQDRLLN